MAHQASDQHHVPKGNPNEPYQHSAELRRRRLVTITNADLDLDTHAANLENQELEMASEEPEYLVVEVLPTSSSAPPQWLLDHPETAASSGAGGGNGHSDDGGRFPISNQ